MRYTLEPKLAVIREQIANAREEAMAEAKKAYPCIKSRGTFLCTADANGEQCRPAPEAEAMQWDGTLRELRSLVRRVEFTCPNVAEVYIAGGYDGASTVRDLCEQADYEPWVASWKVTVARRERATQAEQDRSQPGCAA